MVSRSNSAVALSLGLLCCGSAFDLQYGKTWTGDGTYYGGTDYGNCAIRDPVPEMYSGMMAVAMNGAQYAESASCGACLRVRGSGEGSGAKPITGEFLAWVSDSCKDDTCLWGHIDLGVPGDGRWKVEWEFIPCPGDGRINFKFEGSNPWYTKIQPRGMKTPATRVKVGGTEARSTDDNFFIVDGQQPNTKRVEVWTQDGSYYDEQVTGHSAEGVVYGGFPQSGGGGVPAPAAPQAQNADSGGGGGGQCTADYQKCAGAEGYAYHQYHPCCSAGWECVEHADMNGSGKQCRPAGGR